MKRDMANAALLKLLRNGSVRVQIEFCRSKDFDIEEYLGGGIGDSFPVGIELASLIFSNYRCTINHVDAGKSIDLEFIPNFRRLEE